MTLPLLTRTREDDPRFALVSPFCGVSPAPGERMPSRRPGAGEQYRFHVDMSRCIGCKCCVVACNEQNGNPAAVNWRRVAEVEGGWYPETIRSYLSMGCNHCLDPTCLAGCPVDAYSKDAATGIVRHDAETCIGCQYCTWNCSYGVPQYNAERGVVGKCDMCYGRLALDQTPACVGACPEGALTIELVETADWRAAANDGRPGRGLPAGDASVSTTRVTMPAHLPPGSRPPASSVVRPEHPHWPLVLMTVFTQLAAGAFTVVWALQMAGQIANARPAAMLAFVLAAIALAAATFHLGRPAHAYRALKMWRRSWLSREVMLFALFLGAGAVTLAALWCRWTGAAAWTGLTAALGAAGVTASARIYLVPSRPAWNTAFTWWQFVLTAALLGCLAVAAGDAHAAGVARLLAAGFATAQLLAAALQFKTFHASARIELRGAATLLSTDLRPVVAARVLLLLAGGIIVPLAAASPSASWIALALATAGEIGGRYLFFVAVVPKHLATPYLEIGSEAA